tara:strand:+ start:5609 stop:5971 length:363 start_codon:yes stop_codon:yes gene_type:complete
MQAAHPSPPEADLDAAMVTLEQICDALQRAVDGGLAAGAFPGLAASAAPIVAVLTAAGRDRRADFLGRAIRHLEVASRLWSKIVASPTTATTRDFDDEVYQAFDCACWALQWDAVAQAAA